jgi:hypothetical protein
VEELKGVVVGDMAAAPQQPQSTLDRDNGQQQYEAMHTAVTK